MRVAIACSGLGHIARGVESWAADTADALVGLGIDVTLFSAADKPAKPYEICLECRRRGEKETRRLAGSLPDFCWRWGLTSPYGIEQASFTWQLQKHLRKKSFDIVHVQDAMVADWCRRLRQMGRLTTREILSNGTEEDAAFLARFPYVLHLVQWHYEQVLDMLTEADPEHAAIISEHWGVIPNFVDTEIYRPASDRRTPLRERLGIGVDERVFGCAAAIKKDHKRIDYLIREFAALLDELATAGKPLPWLLVAGAAHDDSPELQSLAEDIGHGHIHIFLNIPRARMPAFYHSLDVFVMTSLFEMQGIAIIEALASGVPAIVHEHPVLQYVVNGGGAAIDLSVDGNLVAFLRDGVSAEWIRERGRRAREHVVTSFSRDAVSRGYVRYYEQVLAASPAR